MNTFALQSGKSCIAFSQPIYCQTEAWTGGILFPEQPVSRPLIPVPAR